MQKIPVVVIAGRPNVGKSTLFNRLIGFRQAVVSRDPGTTRDRVLGEVVWNGKPFVLIDTAGYQNGYFNIEENEIEQKAQKNIQISLTEASVILFVIDAKSGITQDDESIAREIRKNDKRTILVINKADDSRYETLDEDYKKLGAKEMMAVSAVSGRRTGNLLDLITSKFSSFDVEKSNITRLAIIGRPNVGKSALFNSLIGSEKAIVSKVAGTTRDSNNFRIKLREGSDEIELEIIDTAGLRRRGKISPGVEKFSVVRTIETVYRSDIVLLLIDSGEGITRNDAHLGQFVIDRKKELIIVLNKIDLLPNKTKAEIKNLTRFPFLAKKIFVAVSADKKINLGLLKREIFKVAYNIRERSGI